MNKDVKDLRDLAKYIAKRDNISEFEAEEQIAQCQIDMETAFFNGDLGLAEAIMHGDLNLDNEFFNLFIN